MGFAGPYDDLARLAVRDLVVVVVDDSDIEVIVAPARRARVAPAAGGDCW